MVCLAYLKRGVGLLMVVPLIACTVDVRGTDAEKNGDVDIRTPVGSVSVRTSDAPDTGLPAYPGATPLRDGSEPESANVNVGAFGFGVKVAAGKFESSDSPQAVLAFYRKALKPLGAVTECRGDVDFRRGRAVCSPDSSEQDVQLVTGTEHDQRVVAVKPRGSGSEIALVHVRTSGVD
jgi:hypothetical protein